MGRRKPPCNKCPQGVKKPGDSKTSYSGPERDEPVRNLEKSKPLCNKCSPERRNFRDEEKISSVSEIDEPIKKPEKSRVPCKQCPPKIITAEDKISSSDSEKVERENETPPKVTSMSSTTKGKSQNVNFQNKPCDYCKSAKSEEKVSLEL